VNPFDGSAAEDWIRTLVRPAGPIEPVHQDPWSTVLRVPLGNCVVWFKACAPAHAFEPRLTGDLFDRWPDRVSEVLGRDDQRAWLLLADAGTPTGAIGNPPETWLQALPLYAELQLGEMLHTREHLAHGVPDLRLEAWPTRYDELLSSELPLETDETQRLRNFATHFTMLCTELEAHDLPATIQHDDLHMANVYRAGERLRLLDWGDSSISHPFVSLVVTFRFLEEVNRLVPGDRWYTRLRDAYLEPWGHGYEKAFSLALRAGAFAHAFASVRQRGYLLEQARPAFDVDFAVVLRRAIRQIEKA
jgi:hypothetical protein